MSEKYIDLLTDIAEDTARVSFADQAAIHSALSWLDDHPDQVPGRTITESKYKKHTQYFSISEVGAFNAGLHAAGVSVVPDPEPSNAEKLADFLRRHDLDSITNDGADEFARQLDADGVKAPGGDDE